MRLVHRGLAMQSLGVQVVRKSRTQIHQHSCQDPTHSTPNLSFNICVRPCHGLGQDKPFFASDPHSTITKAASALCYTQSTLKNDGRRLITNRMARSHRRVWVVCIYATRSNKSARIRRQAARRLSIYLRIYRLYSFF